MKTSLRIKFMSVTAFIALSFITSAHGTKTHYLNNVPTSCEQGGSHVDKLTKSISSTVNIAATWDDGISSVRYLSPNKTLVGLKQNIFAKMSISRVNRSVYYFYIIYINSQQEPKKIIVYVKIIMKVVYLQRP